MKKPTTHKPEWPAGKQFPRFANDTEMRAFLDAWSFGDVFAEVIAKEAAPKRSGARRAPAKAPAAKKTRRKR